MARYNEILVGRINRGLQKYFGIKGDAPVPQLAGDVSVNHQLFSGVENRYLEGWDRYGAGVNVTPVAANMSGIRFRNPVGSNLVAVLERVSMNEAQNDVIAVRMGTIANDLTTVQATSFNRLDSRSRPGPTCILSQQATAPAVPALTNQFTIDAPDLLGHTTYVLQLTDDQEITLLPGDGFQLEATTVNQNLRGFIWWRERFLEESERT
jgi:hypothetical protein